jgi:D-beta-D-heptose 7-phosphate kinase/D-beta-D-heptose 1-phosphate adenosyltransferase
VTFLDSIQTGSFVVIGDLMVDEYNRGSVKRISPEAPIPVLDFEARERAPGGAANVALNLAMLGNTVELIGLVGDDEAGRWLMNALREYGVGTEGIVTDPSRQTTQKVRFTTVHQAMLRVDYECREHPAPHIAAELAASIDRHTREAPIQGVLISDYSKGVFVGHPSEQPVLARLRQLSRLPLLVAADTKKRGGELGIFTGFDFVKPNMQELSKAVGMKIDTEKALHEACQIYYRLCGARSLLITLGEGGIYHYDGTNGMRVSTVSASVYDVTGAGDTVFAAVMMARGSGLSWSDAMRLANIAASVAIENRGTHAITMDELRKRVKRIEVDTPDYFIAP